MGIEKFIQKVCVQTAVYWGNPQDDGYGGKTYDEGVEIACRWGDKQKISGNIGQSTTGVIFQRDIEVLLTQDVDIEGYLFLGTLADLNAVGLNKLITDFIPNEMPGAFRIKGFDKIPLIKSGTKFVRTAYL